MTFVNIYRKCCEVILYKDKIYLYLYKNNFALPWGYTYDSYTAYDDLDQMNGLQLEELMSHNIILENDIIAEFPEINKIIHKLYNKGNHA